MSEEWLQLTEEDIERAHQLARQRPVMPGVITITADDVASDVSIPSQSDAILSITKADLEPVSAQTSTTPALRQLEQLMFELVNEARRSNLPRWVGTADLMWSEELAAVARGHSNDMLKRRYVAHESPEGVTAARRINEHGIHYVACGENIGVFYGDLSNSQQAIHDIHNAFMGQPKSLTNHRGNLLNPIWTHVGIGIAFNVSGAIVATQNFISAPAKRLRGR